MLDDLGADLLVQKTLERCLSGTAMRYDDVLADIKGQLAAADWPRAKDMLDHVLSFSSLILSRPIEGNRYIIKNHAQRASLKEEIAVRRWFEDTMREHGIFRGETMPLARLKTNMRHFEHQYGIDLRIGFVSNMAEEFGVYVTGGGWNESGRSVRGGEVCQIGPFIDKTEIRRCRWEIVDIVDDGAVSSIEQLEALLADIGFSKRAIRLAMRKENIKQKEKLVCRGIVGTTPSERRYQ